MKLVLSLFCVLLTVGVFAQTTKYSPKDLESWQSIGTGKGYVTHGQFMMEEVDGSKGFMLLSPEKYNDVVLWYRR